MLKLAKEKGFNYNPKNGIVTTPTGVETERTTKNGYIHLSIYKDKKRHSFLGHQFAWFYLYNEIAEEIDHINGDKTDNRILNLRSVTHQQNMWNVKNALGYSFHKKYKKYMAYITINRKMKYLGYYENENEAKQAYLNAKKQLHKI